MMQSINVAGTQQTNVVEMQRPGRSGKSTLNGPMTLYRALSWRELSGLAKSVNKWRSVDCMGFASVFSFGTASSSVFSLLTQAND
jgi:hypothetical protein